MKRIILLIGFCVGCGGAVVEEPALVFDAVLKHEFKGPKQPDAIFMFVDGKDPAPEVLDKMRKDWPMLQPGSKAPQQGKAIRFSFSDLKWIDRNHAEVRGGSSDGMDGYGRRYNLTRKEGKWAVEKAVTEVES